jgi:hypothetical protein
MLQTNSFQERLKPWRLRQPNAGYALTQTSLLTNLLVKVYLESRTPRCTGRQIDSMAQGRLLDQFNDGIFVVKYLQVPVTHKDECSAW